MYTSHVCNYGYRYWWYGYTTKIVNAIIYRDSTTSQLLEYYEIFRMTTKMSSTMAPFVANMEWSLYRVQRILHSWWFFSSNPQSRDSIFLPIKNVIWISYVTDHPKSQINMLLEISAHLIDHYLILPFPLESRGWFMILVFITSAGVPIVAAVNAAATLDIAWVIWNTYEY